MDSELLKHIILSVVFVGFVIIGIGIFYEWLIKPMVKIRKAKSWLSVDCLIVSSGDN